MAGHGNRALGAFLLPVIFFPALSALIWLGMLLGMLLWWIVAQGSPIYPSMQAGQTIAYISDVGAQELKPLFIAGSAATVVLLDGAILADRWLRSRGGAGLLVPNVSVAEKVLAGLSLVFALLGTLGLILLSIFDTLRYPHRHDACLACFIVGYVLCAIVLCAEYQRLGIKYREYRVLRSSFWIKLSFVLLEVALAIAFGVLNVRKMYNAAAIIEWVIALIFSFWVLSFLVDLWPALERGRERGRGGSGSPHSRHVVKERGAMGSEENGLVATDADRPAGALSHSNGGIRDSRRTNLAGNF